MSEAIFKEVKRGTTLSQSPIFIFVCPRCKTTLYRGVVDFDMEDAGWECVKCGCQMVDAWDYPHTLEGFAKKKNIWTIGGHYSNDPMTSLSIDEVLNFFLWVSNPKGTVHGGEPMHIGTLEECCKISHKAHSARKP